MKNLRGNNKNREILMLCFIFLALYLPFLNKAFHIDDAYWIMFSKMACWNPFEANYFNFATFGMLKEDYLIYDQTHPLFIPYFIKIITSLFGESEIALHLSFLVFPILFIFSTAFLNTSIFLKNSTGKYIAVLLCSFPAFLVNSHNVMTDVPTLAFLISAMAFYSSSIEKSTINKSYAGGTFLGLAVFTSYQAFVFIPLILFYAFLKKRVNIHFVLSLLIPVLTMAIWLTAIYKLYDLFPLFTSKESAVTEVFKLGFIVSAILGKIINVFALIGSSMLFVIPPYLYIKKPSPRLLAIYLAFFLLSLLSLLTFIDFKDILLFKNILLSILLSLGFFTVYIVVDVVLKRFNDESRARDIFLLTWIGTVIIYNILLLPFGAARYLLPVFPPIVMILINNVVWESLEKRSLIIVMIFLSSSVIFGISNAYSDYRYAGVYRSFAEELKVSRATKEKNAGIWYLGEWGMRHYMDKIGAKYLLANSNEPRKGDIVIVPEMPPHRGVSPALAERLRYFNARTYASGFPLRLFNRRSNAGFYCHYWGRLPFSFSVEPDEVFTIYTVGKQ